jgi:hypothetical protein
MMNHIQTFALLILCLIAGTLSAFAGDTASREIIGAAKQALHMAS